MCCCDVTTVCAASAETSAAPLHDITAMLEQLVWPGLSCASEAQRGPRAVDALWMLSMWPAVAHSLILALRQEQEQRPQPDLVPRAISIAREMLQFALEASTIRVDGAAVGGQYAADRAEACCSGWNDLYCAMDE